MPNLTIIQTNPPSNLSVESGNRIVVDGGVTYSSNTVTYSSSTNVYGGVISNNQGRAPSITKLDNTF